MPELPRAVRLVLAREVRAHRRAFLFWVVAVGFLLVMVLSLQPQMAQKGSMLEAKLEMLPDALKNAFGLDQLDFSRPAAYLAVNFVYVTLTAPLSAALLGANLIAKEEVQRTAEILLTQPVSRTRILLGKTAALALHIALFHLLLGALTLGALAIVVDGPFEAGMVASFFAGTASLAVCFGGAGMLLATLVPRPRLAGNAALAAVLGAYLLSVLGATSPSLAWLGWISPFRAVAPPRILHAGGLDPVAGAILCAIGVGGAVAAIVRYRRRDIMT